MAQSIARAFQVLSVFAAAPKGRHMREVAALCPEIAPATLTRLVRSLVEEALLAPAGPRGRYVPGPALRTFALTVIQGCSHAELLAPVVAQLAEATGESAAYYELDSDRLRLLAKTDMPRSWHHVPTGSRTGRMHLHAFSVVLLALCAEAEVRRILTGEGILSPPAIDAFIAALPATRRGGLYLGPEEADKPISRAVAPVLVDEQAIGAIGVTLVGRESAAARRTDLSAAVQQAAAQANRILTPHLAQEEEA